MSGSSKHTLTTKPNEETSETEEATDERVLSDGRKLVITEGSEPIVEIRAASGLLELRIQLTEAGPVIQMEAVRMQLKATESVEIESARVAIKGTKAVAIEGGQVDLEAKEDVDTGASGEVRVRGKTIWLN
ncbi:MAG: hypothetical protein NT062_14670 [Proteobacteria bacterium]|nr:hypothetical protein [Pseudomonadota bacterium]